MRLIRIGLECVFSLLLSVMVFLVVPGTTYIFFPIWQHVLLLIFKHMVSLSRHNLNHCSALPICLASLKDTLTFASPIHLEALKLWDVPEYPTQYCNGESTISQMDGSGERILDVSRPGQ